MNGRGAEWGIRDDIVVAQSSSPSTPHVYFTFIHTGDAANMYDIRFVKLVFLLRLLISPICRLRKDGRIVTNTSDTLTLNLTQPNSPNP